MRGHCNIKATKSEGKLSDAMFAVKPVLKLSGQFGLSLMSDETDSKHVLAYKKLDAFISVDYN